MDKSLILLRRQPASHLFICFSKQNQKNEITTRFLFPISVSKNEKKNTDIKSFFFSIWDFVLHWKIDEMAQPIWIIRFLDYVYARFFFFFYLYKKYELEVSEKHKRFYFCDASFNL